MDIESFDLFNFKIPEKKPNSIWTKILLVSLIGIFVSIPLAKIDSSNFNYNEVYIFYGHQDCSHLKYNLISCQ